MTLSHADFPQVTRKTDSRNRIKSVQALRAIAALFVVVAHATALWQDKAGRGAAYIFTGGLSGVDLFFVISGFIILVSGMPFAGKPGGPTRFFELRLIRLVPIYWLATSLKLALVMVAPASVLVNGRPGAWNILASYLFIPSANAEGLIVPVLVVGWTLSFEMLFYIIFAIALGIVVNPLVVILPVLILVSLVSLLHMDAWPAFTSLANPLLLEFCFGMIVGQLYRSKRLERLPEWTGLLLLVASFGYLLTVPAPDPWSRAFGWGIAAACALAGAIVLERRFIGRLADAMVLQGEASYSLYLVHGFVLPVVGFAVVRLHLPNLALGAVIVVAATGSSVIASTVTHIYVERPLTNVLRRLAHDRRNQGSPASPNAPI